MKDKSTFIFPVIKLFNLFVGFNELNRINGKTKTKISIKVNKPPIPIFFFLPTFLPIGVSSFSSASAYASKMES